MSFSCHKTDVRVPDYEPLPPVFTAPSPFKEKIPPGAPTDPNSDAMIKGLVRSGQKGFVIAVKEWTVPVYVVKEGEKVSRYDVRMRAPWAPKKYLRNVPIPDYAVADPEWDGHMTIIDLTTGCVFDFWQMQRTMTGRWSASWGNALPIESNGIYPGGYSARGSGFGLLLGVITPEDLERGYIDHALLFSYDYGKAGGAVPPATESDGTDTHAWAIPEGARLQLDPNLNLDSLNLTPYERIIARALQEYGMILGDVGGGVQLYAVNPISWRNNPYKKWWGEQKLVDISAIPLTRFRVLKLARQVNPPIRVIPNRCTSWN